MRARGLERLAYLQRAPEGILGHALEQVFAHGLGIAGIAGEGLEIRGAVLDHVAQVEADDTHVVLIGHLPVVFLRQRIELAFTCFEKFLLEVDGGQRTHSAGDSSRREIT